jgi:precorrin-2 dehydrogenase/sirohydrochlorin ferrochelatase
MLDVADRLAVIIGGGAVAARKARGLIDAGASRIRVVAPEFAAEIPATVERITAAYQPAHLEGAELVFAATDSGEVNERVVRDARSRGVWVNRVDDEEPGGDFVTAAAHRRGEVLLAVAAGSAALAVTVRNSLADRLDDRCVRMSQVMTQLRPQIRRDVADAHKRAEIFRELARDDALNTLATGGEAGLRQWLAQRYPELKL